MTSRPSAIPPGSFVILKDTQGEQRTRKLEPDGKDLLIGKYPALPVATVLGVPLGATLRYENGGWVRAARFLETDDGDSEVKENNSTFAQDGSAQALNPADISDLKAECSGQEVVAAIAAGSATFDSRTKFSKEKYIRKKQMKHVQQVSILKPTLMDLAEGYWKESRLKSLRFDYLSSVLTHGNVHSGGRYFVLDCVQGLVTAAVLQQLAGNGRVIRGSAKLQGGCSNKAVHELNLSAETKKVETQMPLEVAQCADPFSHEWAKLPDALPDTATDEEKARLGRRLLTITERRNAITDLKGLVDGCMIVGDESDPQLTEDALKVGLSFLAPGGQVVLYGSNLQPLAARQGAMKAGGQFIDVRLIQLFTREFQVLPMRTHPLMQADMHHTEGFLLVGVKVAEDAGSKKRRTT